MNRSALYQRLIGENMKSKFLPLSFLLLFLLLSVSACGAKESTDVKNDIVGKWVSDDKSLTLEFTAEQKIHSVYDAGNFTNTMDSDTVWMDDNTLLGVWEMNMTTWNVRILGDKMELKSDDGRKLIMYRSE